MTLLRKNLQLQPNSAILSPMILPTLPQRLGLRSRTWLEMLLEKLGTCWEGLGRASVASNLEEEDFFEHSFILLIFFSKPIITVLTVESF
ncbi:hypothetical protein Anas_14659, partial [Armadillidium nasatum]